MKKNILVTILVLSFGSFVFSGTIQPSLSMRFNDVLSDTNDIIDPTLVVGLTMGLSEGVTAGLDSDGDDSRIFVSFEYGTMGMGIDENGEPQFTIGAKYSALSNLDVSLDYIVNNLTTSGPDGGAIPNQLRMSLGVTF